MKYLKLFLPIPIVFIAMFLSEKYLSGIVPLDDLVEIERYVFVVGFFVYYLRLDNNRTPLINTLTVLVLGKILGEYLVMHNSPVGPAVSVISALAFAIVFFIRQKLKPHFNTLSKIKIAAVSLFALANIIAVTQDVPVVFGFGTLVIALVYLYDRLIKIADGKLVS